MKKEKNEKGWQVMTGRAQHRKAEGNQRNGRTKGTDPPQFPNEERMGE